MMSLLLSFTLLVFFWFVFFFFLFGFLFWFVSFKGWPTGLAVAPL